MVRDSQALRLMLTTESAKKPSDTNAGVKKTDRVNISRAYEHNQQRRTAAIEVLSMAARVTHYPAQVLRARQSMMPVPPVHRGAMLSSLIWSLSNPSASMPYLGLKPTPSPAPAFSQVIKRGMATMKHSKSLESEEDALARFHRAVRDESESFVDMWSLPLETLGVCDLCCVFWGPNH
jgi:hypothetical protein